MWLRRDCHYWIYTVTIVLSHLWLNITCQSHPGYDIQISPQRVTVQEGLSVLITCNFTANNKKTFSAPDKAYWTRCNIYTYSKFCFPDWNDSPNERKNIKLTGNPRNGDCSLAISDVKKQDAGNYIFRFEGGVKYYYVVKYLTVDVSDSPSINITTDINVPFVSEDEIKTEAVIVKEGTSLMLKCSVKIDHKANVTWMKGEKTIVPHQKELEIQNVTHRDGGTYICSASNINGSSSKSVNIIVELIKKDYWDTVRNLMIRGACGVILMISTILIVKFYTKMRENKKTHSNITEEPAVNDASQLYRMDNIPAPKQKSSMSAVYADTDRGSACAIGE